jgi:osmotically-inducible protein OsmY
MKLQTTILSNALGLALALAMTPASAHDQSLEQAVNEAKLEGQIGTAILLNRHLNPFEISVDVEGDTAILSGTVDEAVDKELAERVALNARGIARVDNKIAVETEAKLRERRSEGERDFDEAVEDASITASVKSRLLWNDVTDGLEIDVDTLRGKVTLSGKAGTQAEKDLATRLARLTDGVRGVDNRIAIAPDGEDDADEMAEERAERRGDTDVDRPAESPVSDGWISAKVKSSLLMSAGVDGLDLSVETQEGQVKLGGAASSVSERDLAVEIAKDIKGVKGVDASGVRIGSDAGIASDHPDD